RRRRGLRLFWALVGQDRPDHSIYQSDSLLRALTPLRLSGLPDGSWPVLRNGEPSDGEQRRAKVRRVGICVGGSKVSKRWPVPRFAAVVRRLADDDIEFVAIGGADDRQRLLALYEEAPEVRWAASTVDLDVLGLARAVARLDLLISNDTGPAHLAAGYGVPLVAIFGPTSWVRWAPPSSRRSVTVVRHAVECAPCSNFGGDRCPRADSAWTCMLGLEPQRVVHAAQTLLRGRQAL
ncbi:MAG: glycosyltransferase family 9 protein, partial [Myxococcota bacterium]